MFYGGEEEEETKITCECGAPAAKKVSSKPGPNCGREFFTCAVRAANPMNKDEGCSFFQAADGQPWTGSGGMRKGPGQPRQFYKRAVAAPMPRATTTTATAPPPPRASLPPPQNYEPEFTSPPPPKMPRVSPVVDDLTAVLANAASATSLVTAKLETLLTRAEQLFRKAAKAVSDAPGSDNEDTEDPEDVKGDPAK